MTADATEEENRVGGGRLGTGLEDGQGRLFMGLPLS